MKNLSQIISILVMAMACVSCDSGGNAPKWLGDTCLSDAQCNGLICEGYVCTYRCQDSGCAYGLYCTSSGHCMAEPDKSTSGCFCRSIMHTYSRMRQLFHQKFLFLLGHKRTANLNKLQLISKLADIFATHFLDKPPAGRHHGKHRHMATLHFIKELLYIGKSA